MLMQKSTLSRLLFNALIDGFSDDVITTSSFKTTIYFMYVHEIITQKTYLKLLMVTEYVYWYPRHYFEDGSIEYVLSNEKRIRIDIEKSHIMRCNPRKVLLWIVDTLKKDEYVHNYLSLDTSYWDLMLSAKEISVHPGFKGIEMQEDELGVDIVLYKNVLFYFILGESSYSLYYKSFGQIDPFWTPTLGVKIREGMSGEMLHVENDFYFKFNNMASYLHINVESGTQEILQNIIIIGRNKKGRVFYRDIFEKKISFFDAKGKTKTIAAYDEEKKYLLKDDYILVSSKNSLEMPKRIYVDGNPGSASSLEVAKVFWDYILETYTTFFENSMNLPNEMLKDQLRDIMDHSILSLENMQCIVSFLKENNMCKSECLLTLSDILKKIERMGVDSQEDVSKEMYALTKSQERENGLRSVRTEDDEIYIGVFDVINNKLKTIVRPINYGKVVGNEVVYDDDSMKWRGHFCYDLVNDRFIAKWPTRNSKMTNEVRKKFKVYDRYVYFASYEDSDDVCPFL